MKHSSLLVQSKDLNWESQPDPMSDAADLPDALSDAESIVQVNASLGVGCATPQKSWKVPFNGSSFIPEYKETTTPQKSWSVPFCGSSYTPECDESMKPVVGKKFENIELAKEFYRAYAAHVGFPIRVGQHKVQNGLVLNKRFYCSREGFRKAKDGTQSEPECSERRKCERKITRCGCQAMVAIKRTNESKYIITNFVEDHTHPLVSPNKQHLIRSNREVGIKVKNTLFNFHRGSIGTSDAYHFLRVGLGGFENARYTLRDLQNYHGKLRCQIRSSDAQMFVDQLSRKALANPAFYFDYVIDEKGKLVHAFWADATWGMEKHGSVVFTHEVFEQFQKKLLDAREYCVFESMKQDGELRTMRVADNFRKVRVVQLNTSTMFASCSCMLFETHGIPCRHVIHVLRSAKMDELPSIYVLKRFRKDCKKESTFTPDGVLLEESTKAPVDPVLQKLVSDTTNKMESLFIQAKSSINAMQILRDGVFALGRG